MYVNIIKLINLKVGLIGKEWTKKYTTKEIRGGA